MEYLSNRAHKGGNIPGRKTKNLEAHTRAIHTREFTRPMTKDGFSAREDF